MENTDQTKPPQEESESDNIEESNFLVLFLA
jgi:hypothetical protein